MCTFNKRKRCFEIDSQQGANVKITIILNLFRNFYGKKSAIKTCLLFKLTILISKCKGNFSKHCTTRTLNSFSCFTNNNILNDRKICFVADNHY